MRTILAEGWSSTVVTFNRKSYLNGRTWKMESDLHLVDRNRSIELPNIPMRASGTLLADKLRNGRFVERIGVDRKPFIREPRTGIAMALDRFKGKCVSVEVEHYPAANASYRSRYNGLGSLAYDGSLGDSGRELKKLSWIRGDKLELPGVASLPLTGTVDRTCGLHVHVDCRHLPDPDLLPEGTPYLHTACDTYDRIVSLYPFIKKLVPASRKNNRYCRWHNNGPCGNTGSRYCAVNWHSFYEMGTIEFRCQSGSTNPAKIELWALCCYMIVKRCSEKGFALPATWSGFLAMFPEPLKSWLTLRAQNLAPRGQRITLDSRIMRAMGAE